MAKTEREAKIDECVRAAFKAMWSSRALEEMKSSYQHALGNPHFSVYETDDILDQWKARHG